MAGDVFVMLHNSKLNLTGFTLIEILMVVLLVGILTGIVISIVSPTKTQSIARDGIRKANLAKLASAVESYKQAEGKYPTDAESSDTVSVFRTVYVKNWPDGVDDKGVLDPAWNYFYYYIASTDKFAINVQNSGKTGWCFKYHPSWGVVKECKDSGAGGCGLLGANDTCN